MPLRRLPSATLVLLLWPCLTLGADSGQPRAYESELPAVSSSLQLETVDVPYSYRSFVSPAKTIDGQAATRLRILLDLTGAISTLSEVLQERLPDRRCAGYKPDNWVIKLRELSAETDRQWLLLGLVAEAQLWACVDLKFLGDGQSELGHSYVSLSLPLALEAQEHRVRLEAGRTRIDVDGDLGRAARLYFAARGEDLSDHLAAQVDAIDSRDLQFDLPTLLVNHGALVASAQFVTVGGLPHAEIEIIAGFGLGTWMTMLRSLWGLTPPE